MDLNTLVKKHGLVGFEDVFWNLGQVVAWVETRDPFAVDALSDSTPVLARRDHSLPSGLPHFASEIAASNAKENGLNKLKSPFESLDDVRRLVLREFQAGGLVVWGHRRGSVGRQQIPRIEWVDLVISDNASGEMGVHHPNGYAAEWYNVRVERDEVIRAFPPPVSSARSSRRPEASPTPAGYYPLEKSVLLLAKELDSRIWQTGAMTAREIVAYEGLGATSHYKDLKPVLDNIALDLRDRNGNLPDDTLAQRLASYDKCRGIVRDALLAGDLKSFLLFAEGELREQQSEVWGQDTASSWFEDGIVCVDHPQGRTDAADWACILIDQESFSDWYYSGTGPMAEVEAKERDKGGRPTEYDWDAIQSYMLGIIRQHGVPGKNNKKLRSKSDLTQIILNEWATKHNQHLSESNVRRYVGRWLKEI